MGLEQIGLEAIFKNAEFLKGMSDYISKCHEGEKTTQTVAQTMTKSLSAIGGLAIGGAIAAVGAVSAAIATSIPLASDLSETVSKVGVVFGTSAQEVLNFGASAATALGMSENEALTAAGTYGNLFRSMGMTEKESSGMSTSLIKLAADLASFNNQDPSEVLEKLRAGLTGETEPLKSLGVNLSAAAVEAKAMSMGLAKGEVDTLKVAEAQVKLEAAVKATNTAARKYGAESVQARQAAINEAKAQEALEKAMAGTKVELTASAKAQATYALIMEQTSLAQGDFERTSQGLANQQRIAAAQWKDLRTQVGKIGLNLAGKVFQSFNKILGQVIGKVTEWVGQMDDASTPIGKVVQAVTNFANAVIDSLPLVFDWFSKAFTFIQQNQPILIGILGALGVAIATFVYTTVIPAAIAAITAMAPLILTFLAVGLVIGGLAYLWQTNFMGMQTALTNFWTGTVQPALQELWNWLAVNVPNAIQTVSEFWMGTLLPAIDSVFSWIQANVFPVLQRLWSWLGTAIPAVTRTLTAVWNTVLLPAFRSIYSWMSTVLFPFFQSLANFLSSAFAAAARVAGSAFDQMRGPMQAVVNFINGTVWPALQSFGNWLSGTFGPIFSSVGAAIQSGLQAALEWVTARIQELTNLFNTLADLMDRINGGGGTGTGTGTGENPGNNNDPVNGAYHVSRPGALSSQSAALTPAAAVTNISQTFNLGGQTVNNGMDVAQLRQFIIRTVREAL